MKAPFAAPPMRILYTNPPGSRQRHFHTVDSDSYTSSDSDSESDEGTNTSSPEYETKNVRFKQSRSSPGKKDDKNDPLFFRASPFTSQPVSETLPGYCAKPPQAPTSSGSVFLSIYHLSVDPRRYAATSATASPAAPTLCLSFSPRLHSRLHPCAHRL